MSKYFIFFFLLLLSKPVIAQEERFRFKRYGVEDGLSQGTIRDMAQDAKGFWWFATADGLNRYDGYDFYTYHHHLEDSTTIISGDIQKIFVDNESDIWVFTGTGASKYLHTKDNFKKLHYDTFYARGVFKESNNRHIWMYNQFGNIQVVDRLSCNVIKQFYKNLNGGEAIVPTAYAICNDILYQFGEKKITTFNIKNEQWGELPLAPALGKVTSASVQNNELLLVNQEGTFFRCTFDLAILAKAQISPLPIEGILPFGKNYFFATAKGLYEWNSETQQTQLIKNDPNDSKSLSIDIVTTLATDKVGNLWVGTNSGGLNKLIPQSSKFKAIRTNNYYLIKSIYKNENNNLLYCGVYGKGLDIYDLNKPQTAPITIPTKTDIFKIEFWDEKHLLLFHIGGIQLFNMETMVLNELGAPLLQYNTTPYLQAAFRQTSNKFLIGLNNKIYQFRNLQFIEPFSDETFEGEITCFGKDEKNRVYVGTARGLYFLTEKNKKVLIIPHIYVKHILKTQDNSLWIATTTGLYQYKDGTSPKLYDKDNYGLANDFIYGVVEGAGNALWVSHNKGLSRLNVSKSIFKNFNLSDNLQSFEFNTGAFFKSESENLIFFGGVGGINYFDSNEFFDNPIAPIPIISKIRVNDDDFPMDTIAWYKKSIVLPYAQNTLSFEFTGLQFMNTASSQYYYKMEGIDKEWIFAGNKRFARYPNLSPGKYIFKVRAANDDGNESDEIATFAVQIIAPVYMRWWFLTFLAISFISAIIAAIYYLQRRKYHKQMQALEILTRVKSERERISRDLHDNVGAQITYLITSMDWATKQLPEGNAPLVERFSNLRSNAQNMMSSIRDTIWALNKDEIMVQDFADRLKQYIIYQIRDISSIELSYFENIESNHLMASNTVLNLFRIGQEATQNIIKHSNAHVITVSIICNLDNVLLLAIGDDGKGFDLQNSGFDNFGLDNMKYRADEINAAFQILTVPNKGTTIEIRVPLEDN
jgi:signal transduction histidine kinase